ncbi:hypothetical protein DIURU_004409 [Diutina rugosa]|uniref:Exportin-T n=1 Tax=Diutina rugosa TaxID=5481 RepID=A0A642UJU2_DIURU|nr:uncharacterized protein DIURU_004409 [Diutina rugosa]KAA8899227.1 hypothetical protein DIURU_004409 [Diutina rugosa]
MESQLQQAVEIALSGTSDPHLKQQAMAYCEEVKSSAEGYAAAVGILSQPEAPMPLQFFVYQVLESHLEQLDAAALLKLYHTLRAHLAQRLELASEDPAYLKNKLASLFADLFLKLYLQSYPQFLSDWLEVYATGKPRAVDYYTRTLLAIHTEIGDKFISRSRPNQELIGAVKDQIRTMDMDRLVASWHEILQGGPDRWSDDIIVNTLDLVGSYVSWMEISLFVKPEVVTTIFGYLRVHSARNQCCVCVSEIVAKKMKPTAKLELVAMLDLTTTLNSIGVDDNQDVTFMENLARLINQMGLELVGCIDTSPDLIDQVQPHLYKMWPLALFLLGHEYDDVTQQVFPFIQAFLVSAKKQPALQDRQLLSELLNKVVLKMKYDDDDDGDSDDDGLFHEVRKRLKTFQDSIAMISPDLYIEALPIVINESLFASHDDWRKAELGLYQLTNYGDSLRTNGLGLATVTESPAYFTYREFMVRLIHSDVIVQLRHPKVQLAFFDIVVKHFAFLHPSPKERPGLITRVLEIFMSDVAVFSGDSKVRLRAWYCFYRFLKTTKPTGVTASFVEELTVKLSPLLKIEARPLEENEVNSELSGQLYLLESVALLAALLGSHQESEKVALLNHILSPLFADLEAAVTRGDDLAMLQAQDDIVAIGTVAKGYDDGENEAPESVIAKFGDAASAITITLERMPKHQGVRNAARMTFSRLLPILRGQITAPLSKLVAVIVGAPDLELLELADFLSFLGQLSHAFKKNPELYSLLNNVLSPVFAKVLSMAKTSDDDALIADVHRDKHTLKRSLISLLSGLVLNHQASLLVSESNKQQFPVVLDALLEWARDVAGDGNTAKMAVTQLANLVQIFGGAGGALDDKLDPGAASVPPLDGIDQFLTERVTSLSFEVPFSASFNADDAQHRLVAQEIAFLLKSMYDKRGDDYLGYLRNYLATMGLPSEYTDDLCVNLAKSDVKGFKKYFVTFVRQLK